MLLPITKQPATRGTILVGVQTVLAVTSERKGIVCLDRWFGLLPNVNDVNNKLHI